MSRGGLSSSRGLGRSSSKEALATSRVWTPLRANHFEPPPLSARERAYLVRKSCEAAQELVGRARSTGGPMVWQHVEKHNGVQLYAGSPCSTGTGTARVASLMCGVTSVPGTMKEVASLFELASTRQMKEFARAHREWFYDGVVLHTLAPRTKEKPLHQVTAKWMVVSMPPGVLHRDFCYLECQDKFIDARGRKGWVLGQHSIKLPGCEDLKKEFGLVRGSLYNSGLVVVESEERAGYMDVIYLLQLNLKEYTPVPMSLLRARVLFVAQVRNMLRSKRLNEQRYLSDLELVPRKYRVRCAVCHDSFSLLLLRKMNCRKCGEVVCAACSKEFAIENRNFAATNGGDEVRKLRICMHCFQSITNAPKPVSALVEAAHSSTMSMSFLGYCDDDRRAACMTSRVGGYQSHREEEVPKIFLQSMRREKSSGHRMSSTLPIPVFGADVPPSTSRRFTRGEQDAELDHRSRRFTRGEQDVELDHRSRRCHQQQDYGRSHNHRGSQRMQPSDFRPSQSLSLDDPIARGEGGYTFQMPRPPADQPPASIFDRSATGDLRRPHHGLPRCSSSDMLVKSSCNMSNFSRLQQLSSRERLEQLQREGDYMTRSSVDHRMPDAYMSALQQASRDNHGFDVPPPMYQAPPSEFGAFSAPLDDHPVTPPDFGPYDKTLDDLDGPLPLDMSALTTSASTIPIELNSMSAVAMPPTALRDGGNERDCLRLREYEIQQHRESTSSDSSANSIDIDTYEDPPNLFVAPPILEQQKQGGEQCYEEGVEHLMSNSVPSKFTNAQNLALLRENGKKAAWTHDTDEDSETSMGASDGEEERYASVRLTPLITAPPHHGLVDDSAEETKALENTESTVLPSMSPSAHAAPCKMVERPVVVHSSVGLLLGDPARAGVKTTEVESRTEKEKKAIVKNHNDHDRQLQRSKMKDSADHEYRQVQAQPKQSEVQVTDEKQREDDVEANFLARKHAVDRRNEQVEDEEKQIMFLSQMENGKSAVPHTPSEILGTASGQINGALPPRERTATSPKRSSDKPQVLMKHSRQISREKHNMEMEECQKPLNNHNGSTDHVALDAQKEASNLNSLTAKSTTRFNDRFGTGVSPGSTALVGDLVYAGVQRSSEFSRPSLQGILEQDQTLTHAPPVIPMSVLSADSETMQTSGDDVLERCLQTSSRIPISLFSDPTTLATAPPSTSPVAIGTLDASASSPTTAPASDLVVSSYACASKSTELAVSPQSNINTPPANIPDCCRTMEQLPEVQQNFSPQNVDVAPMISSTPRQSSDSNAALDNFQLNFSASFNAHQQQKAQAVSAASDVDSLSLLPSDGRYRASSSGSNDVQVLRYQSVGSSVLDAVPDTNVLSTSTSNDGHSEDENTLLSAHQLYSRS